MLCEAYRRLRRLPGCPPSRLLVAGYLAPEHRGYLDGIREQMASWGLAGHFDYRGALDRAGKLAFLQTLSVLSVPSPTPTQKGQFLLEAMASGVPVVQPRLGVFTEVVENTGGGVLTDPVTSTASCAASSTFRERRAQEAARSSRLRRRAREIRGAADGRRASGFYRSLLDAPAAGRRRRRTALTQPTCCGSTTGERRVLEVSRRFEGLPGAARTDPGAVGDRLLGRRRATPSRSSGPSGSGKSTLLYILGALEPPTSGTVLLDGENPFALDDRRLAAFRNRHVGFVFQDHHLLPQCSVLENVLVPTLVADERARRRRAPGART